MNSTPLNPIIVNPTSATPQYALIWMHGLGANANDFAQLPMDLNLSKQFKIRFIFPNAPSRAVTINQGMRMPAWFDIKSLSDLKQEDTAGIRDSQAKIKALIQHQIQQGIEARHIFLGGFSQGAAMALLTGLQYETPLAGIIALSGYMPLAHTLTQKTTPCHTQLPIFIGHGVLDNVVPFALAKQTRSLLENIGYNLSWHEYSFAHQVSSQEMQDIRQWLIKQTQ
jgi:phospholipase/carboxylesterase